MPQVKALDHIAIATPDLDASIKFFATLGLQVTHTEEIQERGIRVAFIPVGDTRIELVSPLHENSEVSGFLAKRGGGIHHLAFRADDVDADAQALVESGVKMAQMPAPGAHDCRVAFLHPKSTGGILLELSTPPAEHH